MSKPLVIIHATEADATCDYCDKPVPLVLIATFGDGEQMHMCRADFFKMLRIKSRVQHRSRDEDELPIGTENNGDF